MRKITLNMLNVEKGEEFPITFTEDQSSMFIANVMKAFTDNGYVLSEVIIEKGE